jgi:hypothetical protein
MVGSSPDMGDGVLACFGYPQAHEHDAERSARAGEGMSKPSVNHRFAVGPHQNSHRQRPASTVLDVQDRCGVVEPRSSNSTFRTGRRWRGSGLLLFA